MTMTIRAMLLGLLALGTMPAAADVRSDAAAWCSNYTRETGIGCDVQRCPCGRTTTEKQRWDRRGVRLSVCACASNSDLKAAAQPGPPDCRTDTDCSDGIWCNGTEECRSGECQPGKAPCPSNLCREQARHCDTPCEDRDGDGHGAIHCGGDDCDDRDPNRYPGNTEICDARGIDEDCNPRTVGTLDNDGDGFVSPSCR